MTEIAKQTILSLSNAMLENDIGPVWDVRNNIDTLKVTDDYDYKKELAKALSKKYKK